ncbi:MAG: GAF domain-containing protein [Anaerolineales bacterium]|nr:GAF domain-containing protein [Anaerolineales bacterium]
MLSKVRRFFAPPIFEDPDKTRLARILNGFGWAVIVIMLVLIVNRISTKAWAGGSASYTFPFVVFIILIMQFIIRMGYVRFAGRFAVTLIWITMTYQAAQADGLWDVALISHLAVILLAALMLGWREGVIVGVFSLITIWYFAYQHHIGSHEFNLDPPLNYARDLTAVFVITSVLIYYLVFIMNRSLTESNVELKERLRAEAKLQLQADYLTALHATTLGLVNRLELSPLLESLLARASQLMNTEHVAIDMILDDESMLRQALGFGIFADYNGELTPKGKGLIGKVWERGKIIHAEDYNHWEGRDPEAEYVGFSSVLGAPLKSGDKVIGTLTVAHIGKPKEFTKEQILLLERLAALASIAIDNARLYQEAQSKITERKLAEEKIQIQAEYLNALHETTLGLVNRLELSPLLESIIARAGDLLDTEEVALHLVLPDESALKQEIGNGKFAQFNNILTHKNYGVTGNVWANGNSMLVENYSQWSGRIVEVEGMGFENIICVPLKSSQKVIGVIVAAYTEKQKKFTKEQLTLLEKFAALASVAMDNARLYQEAQTEILERKIIETELRASDERFRKVFNNNKVAISIVTLEDGIFLEANEAFWQITGLSPEKALGHSVLEFSLWNQPEQRQAFVKEILEKKSLANVEVVFPTNKITLGYYELINLKNQHCVLSMFYDVTEIKQIERALQSAESRTRAILESMPDMIFEVSKDGMFLDYVASTEITPLVPPSEFIGKNINQFFPEAIVNQTLFSLERAIATGQLHAFEYELPEDAETRFFEARISAVTDETAIVMVRDISQRKWVETEREKLISELEIKNAESETLSKSVAIVVETLDKSEAIDRILEQLEKVIPYHSASVQLLNENMLEIVSTRGLEPKSEHIGMKFEINENEPAYDLLQGKAPYVLIEDVQTMTSVFDEGAHKIIHAWMAIPLRVKGRLIGIIALDGHTVGQFTKRDAELALTYANQVAIAIENARLFSELQTELIERKKLIVELENKNAELERFTYTVSHDLKSPLITIKGFLGFLEQDSLSGNHARLRGDIQRISDATNKMQALLNELLNLSRVGRLINQYQQVTFNEIVNEALEIVQGRLQANAIKVNVQKDMPSIYVDRQRLVEVLQNLIDNAAKFARFHPNPLIEIGQDGFENDMPIFYVRDNGIGIEEMHHERIFGLFNKLDVDSEGTGVGLALVKRIVELHSGRIWVQSEAGKGATFYFTLPTEIIVQ